MRAAEFWKIDRKRAETLGGFASAAQRADVARFMSAYKSPTAELARTVGKLQPHAQLARTLQAQAPSIELGQRLQSQHEEMLRAIGGPLSADLEKLARTVLPRFADVKRYAPVAEIMRDAIEVAARMPAAEPIPATPTGEPTAERGRRLATPALVLQLGLYLTLLQAILIAAEDAAGEIPAGVEHAVRILAAAAVAVGENLRQRGSDS